MKKFIILLTVFMGFSLLGASIASAKTSVVLQRGHNDSTVYRIVNNKKLYIPTEKIFLSYGYKWEDVSFIYDSTLSNYPSIKLIKAEDDPSVYLIDDYLRITHIPNEEVFKKLFFKWEDVYEVSREELNFFVKTDLIKAKTAPEVFKVEDGKRRWILSENIFNQQGYEWSKIMSLESKELKAFKEGKAIDSGLVQIVLDLDKDTYVESERLDLKVNLGSSKNLSNVYVIAEGVKNIIDTSHFSDSKIVNILAGEETTIEMSKILPQCHSCTGISAGEHFIKVTIKNYSDVVAQDIVYFNLVEH